MGATENNKSVISSRSAAVRRRIDSINWRIEQIRQATGDTKTAQFITMEAQKCSWPMPVTCQTTEQREFYYDEISALYEANAYLQILENAYSAWQIYSDDYKKFCERVQLLGDGHQVELTVSLKGAELRITPEFLSSREAVQIKQPETYYGFSQLSLSFFENDLKYLEWKDQTYQAEVGRKRRMDLATQILDFENWEDRTNSTTNNIQ